MTEGEPRRQVNSRDRSLIGHVLNQMLRLKAVAYVAAGSKWVAS